MCPDDPLFGRHGILQIQVLKPLIAESGVVLPQELGLYKGPLVLERGIIGVNFTLCFHDQRLMDRPILPLNNEKVRGIHPDISPTVSSGSVALDLELGHSPIAVVVDLQPELFHLSEGQYILQELLFKIAVCAVGQIVEGAVFLRVGGIFSPQLVRRFCVAVLLQRLDGGQDVRLDFEFARIVQYDILHHRLHRVIVLNFIWHGMNDRLEVGDIQQRRLLRDMFRLAFVVPLLAKRLADVGFRCQAVILGTEISPLSVLIGNGFKNGTQLPLI